MTLTPKFDAKAADVQIMDAKAYHQLLENLLANGKGYGKTKNVGAFLLRDLNIETQTATGLKETTKTIKVESLYILMDLAVYPLEKVRQLVIKNIAENWGRKIIGERELNDPDFQAAGIWVNKPGAVEFDYLKANPGVATDSVWKPNPDAYRVGVQVASTVKIPVQWGDFKVEAGGHVVIRERDVQALHEALQSIREGKATVEQALYTTNEKGQTLAKFDVYGIEPLTLGKTYDPVELKDATKAVMASHAAPDEGNVNWTCVDTSRPSGPKK